MTNGLQQSIKVRMVRLPIPDNNPATPAEPAFAGSTGRIRDRA
jgi:hypothetical protein